MSTKEVTEKRIRNTFSTAQNEYFTAPQLFAAYKHGLSFDAMPPEAQEMLQDYMRKKGY